MVRLSLFDFLATYNKRGDTPKPQCPDKLLRCKAFRASFTLSAAGYIQRIDEDLSSIQAKKDRLLEMSIEGVISMAEFKQRNDGFNEQAKALEAKRAELQAEAEKGKRTAAQLEEIRAALERELTFQNGVNSALVTTILDKIVVKKGSTKEKLLLDIYLKFGGPCGVVFHRETSSFRFSPCLTEVAKEGYLWKARGCKRYPKSEPLCSKTLTKD